MKKEKYFWGLLFVLLGVFLIVSKLGYFADVNVFSLLMTAFFIVVIVKSIFKLNFAGILFPLAFIAIMYDEWLGITSITPWTVLFAATLGSIGLSMIFHKHNKWINVEFDSEDYKFEKIDVEDEDHVRFKTSFSGSIKYINTDNFEQADLNCSFGGMKVYFDHAVMKNNNAIVRLDASFSGVELFIPKEWKVQNKTNVFLASIEEKNSSSEMATNTLTLVGDIKFSGVEIIYV
jgi:predicted membrane protein